MWVSIGRDSRGFVDKLDGGNGLLVSMDEGEAGA
jgi:hypothetical protein